jgi:3-deoxy-D-manno-octulosonic-acid transferase
MFKHPALRMFLARLLGRYLVFALRTTSWTLRGEAHAAAYFAGQPCIAAFWHERLPLMPALWRMAASARAENRMHVLVSRHRDGRFIAEILRRFGAATVHGSSSRGGAAGMRSLLHLLARGEMVAITPDGPRGPRRQAAPGVAQIAALAEVAILPCAAQTNLRLTLPSWDRMSVPLPFGRGVLVCGPPMTVPRRDWPASMPGITAALDAAAALADRGCLRRPLSLVMWSLAARLAAPLLPAWLARRARRGREVPERLNERFGIDPTPRPAGKLLWLHAASVGETVSILPVLHELNTVAPHLTILVTTGTVTSARLLAERAEGFGCHVLHRFVPLDVPGWVGRFLDHWRPDAGGFVESELWPNLLMAAHARGIPLILLNARMSARSLARWRRAPRTAAAMLGCFQLVQARSAADADRLSGLGAATVTAPGDLKFAAPPLPADPDELARLGNPGRPAWLAASVHPQEADAILSAHRQLAARYPDLLTIIAPRHPDRADAFCGIVPTTRRSRNQPPPPGAGVWLIDTLGELGLCYRLARIVLVGGSLFPHGGQNVLEPARLGCAIAVGPYTGNFSTACAALEQVGGLTRLAEAGALAQWVWEMLDDPQRRTACGHAAQQAASAWQDLPRQTAATLLSLLPG